MTIGSRLADEAARREISHQDAADMIGVSQATFSRWVNGTNLPGAPYFTKLARFLRTNRDDVAAVVATERAATNRADRLEQLERDVSDLRKLLRRVADHLGLER